VFTVKIYLPVLFLLISAAAAFGQAFIPDIMRDSARSDLFTGGQILRGELIAGGDNLRITVNVPAFQLTLWQNGREVRSYPIGIGLAEYPLYIGRRAASSIEWNPVWIPPSSDWIEKSVKVRPGEIILPTDPRNPLGKVKIPLGYGYLIHQAKGPADLGSLVSHGCIRVMQRDLYDLAEKIVAARALDVSAEQIAAAKASKKTLIAKLDPVIPVELTYDTIVIESGRLHIYPDVYPYYRKNTIENLRNELGRNGIDHSRISDLTLRKMLGLAKGRNEFVVYVGDLAAGNALRRGHARPIIPTPASRIKRSPPGRKR
jgi:hypothetical protein